MTILSPFWERVNFALGGGWDGGRLEGRRGGGGGG